MSKRNDEFKIGIMVLSFSVVVVWLVLKFGAHSFPNFVEEYSLYANFDGISGIDRNTPVNRNGVKIGRVDTIEPVDEAEKSFVRVKLMIRKDRQVFSNDECRIITGLMGVGGNAHLEIVKRSNYDKEIPVVEMKDGEPIPGVVPRSIVQSLTHMETEFTSAVKSFNTTTKKVEQFVDTVNTVVGTPETAVQNREKILAVIAKSGETIEQVDELVTNINKLFSDEQLRSDLQKATSQLPGVINALARDIPPITETLAKDLPKISQTLANDLPAVTKTLAEDLPKVSQVFTEKVPQMLDKVQEEIPTTLEQIRSTAENLGTLTNEARVALNRITTTFDVAQSNLEKMDSFTTALEEDGPEILKSVRQASRKLDGVFNDITMLTTALRNPDGSLGQLINNPELYQNVQQTIANAEQITESLKPILSDIRIFSDKISRNPGVFITGAAHPETAVKGLPSSNFRAKLRNANGRNFEHNFDPQPELQFVPQSQEEIFPQFDPQFDSQFGSKSRSEFGLKRRLHRNPKYDPQVVLLGSDDLWFEQPRKKRNGFSLIPQWSLFTKGKTFNNDPYVDFRSENRFGITPSKFRFDFWNRNKPMEIVTDYHIVAPGEYRGQEFRTNEIQTENERRTIEPRKLATPLRSNRTARRLNQPQAQRQSEIVQVQYRVPQQQNAQPNFTQPNFTQQNGSYIEGVVNPHVGSFPMENTLGTSGHSSVPGPIYGQEFVKPNLSGQNFEGIVHEGQNLHDNLMHEGQNLYNGVRHHEGLNLHDELFHGEQYMHGNISHNGSVYGDTAFYGNASGLTSGFGMPMGSGRTRAFFEEMRIRGIIFRENVKGFFYGLRGKFGGGLSGGGFGFGGLGTIETNQNGLFSYLFNNAGAGLSWGKRDGFPLASGGYNALLGSDSRFSYGSPSYTAHPYSDGYHEGGLTPTLNFSAPDFAMEPYTPHGNFVQDGNFMQGGVIRQEDYVPNGHGNGFLPQGTIIDPSEGQFDSLPKNQFSTPEVRANDVIPQADTTSAQGGANGGPGSDTSYAPGSHGPSQDQRPQERPQGRAPTRAPRVGPAPDVSAPQNQDMRPQGPRPDTPPPGGGTQQSAPQMEPPQPSFGSQFDPQEIPPTLLEFNSPESSEQQEHEADAEDGVSGGLDFRNFSKTFPTKDRGYIIVLESELQSDPQFNLKNDGSQLAKSAEPVEPVELPQPEIHLSFVPPQRQNPVRPASVVSQASLQSPKSLDTAFESEESEPNSEELRTVSKPTLHPVVHPAPKKSSVQPQYGSVRRGIEP